MPSNEGEGGEDGTPPPTTTTSPEKVASKRSRPNPPTPTKPITIPINSTSNATTPITSLPLWIAGASPAKFLSLEELLQMQGSLEKMALIHEIAVDPQFNVEQLKRGGVVQQAVKESMHKAYWDRIRQEFSADPPDHTHILPLMRDLREMVVEQLSSATHLTNALTAANDILDLPHLQQRLDRKQLDVQAIREVLQMLVSLLKRLCAPIRDEAVQRLVGETDLVELFKGLFELVEQMGVDMANFQVKQNRGTIECYSEQVEREEFLKVLAIDGEAAHATKEWLRQGLIRFRGSTRGNDQPSSSSSSSHPTTGDLTRSDVSHILIDSYLWLLESHRAGMPFPETFKLDELRILALGEKFLQLVLVAAAGFVAANLAGKNACEGTDFKAHLKMELIIILNDVEWGNHHEKMENVFLQCEKNLKEVHKEGWTDSKSALLKEQIMALREEGDPVRQLAGNRILEFIRLVLRRTGEPLRIPPGLSPIQAELASVTSKFYALVIHNWNTFGTLYGQILDELHANGKKDK